ncbi:hypothetical protein EYF88_08320 [Paracoccus sediminis]|uniref:Effector-associated domain-containing protein n=1 Tax=Paracoccus sediminis TaxID=1214787 RepID=A0A238WGP7_9RHOB|nr:effector-associated domain EAD1-containing protein [Paracoccus sediminis]TBN50906.1 hypothetical protein EYF88_08320 [Paracoccus sediminis]SNR44849.1 hypothetical protein SAMN06265378_104117 [Paracoccus sediminis]
MKLNSYEEQQLYKGLLEAFPDRATLDIILSQDPIGKPLYRVVPSGTLLTEYPQLVLAANAQGWIGDLLDGLRAAPHVNPDLIAVIDGFMRLRPPPSVKPHMELLLDGAPFVNQQALRHMLLMMTQPNGPRVLQITGERASGKTYSQNLINHVGRRTSAGVFWPLSIEATTTARDLILELAEAMRLEPPPTLADAPQDSTAVTRMVRWFKAQDQVLDKDWWLIFDGFDSPKIDDSVRMLMSGLAQIVGNGQPDRVRLFLLAWDKDIAGVPPGRADTQNVLRFDRDDLKGYLDELVAQFAMPVGKTSTDQLVDECYDGWDTVPDPLERAQMLTRRIQKVARDALKAKQAAP